MEAYAIRKLSDPLDVSEYTVHLPFYLTFSTLDTAYHSCKMGTIAHKDEALQQSLDQLVSATNQYQKSFSDADRYNVLMNATQLIQTLRGPADMLYAQFENVGQPALR